MNTASGNFFHSLRFKDELEPSSQGTHTDLEGSSAGFFSLALLRRLLALLEDEAGLALRLLGTSSTSFVSSSLSSERPGLDEALPPS